MVVNWHPAILLVMDIDRFAALTTATNSAPIEVLIVAMETAETTNTKLHAAVTILLAPIPIDTTLQVIHLEGR